MCNRETDHEYSLRCALLWLDEKAEDGGPMMRYGEYRDTIRRALDMPLLPKTKTVPIYRVEWYEASGYNGVKSASFQNKNNAEAQLHIVRQKPTNSCCVIKEDTQEIPS